MRNKLSFHSQQWHRQYVCVSVYECFVNKNKFRCFWVPPPPKIHTHTLTLLHSQADTVEMLEHFSHHANDIYVYIEYPSTNPHPSHVFPFNENLINNIGSENIHALCVFHVNIYFRHRNFRTASNLSNQMG